MKTWSSSIELKKAESTFKLLNMNLKMKTILILYTEKPDQSLVISALEIIKYQKLLDHVLGHGSYMLESVNDLN